MKTKGALIREFNQPWAIEEIEIGDPRKDEVKIQMEASGMCHSDHHLVTGGIPMAGFPVLGGHEGAGIVTEVGPGVEHIAPGDHVVLSFIPSCGECPSCQAGMRNLCDLGAGLLGGASVSDGTFRVLVDYPWDEPGHTVDEDRMRATNARKKKGTLHTVCWLPRHRRSTCGSPGRASRSSRRWRQAPRVRASQRPPPGQKR